MLWTILPTLVTMQDFKKSSVYLTFSGMSIKPCNLICVWGYLCEPHNNPADFFLDVINGDSITTATTKASEGSSIIITITYFYKMVSGLLVPYQISVHLEIIPHFKPFIFNDVLFRGRFRLWGDEHFQAEHRGASGGGVQEQQLCQQYQGRAQPHPPRKGVFPVHQVPHHHLQQHLLPPAPLGAEEDLPEPHVEPTNISGTGESQLTWLCLKNN